MIWTIQPGGSGFLVLPPQLVLAGRSVTTFAGGRF